jgi:hypothetical protein
MQTSKHIAAQTAATDNVERSTPDSDQSYKLELARIGLRHHEDIRNILVL